MISSDAVDGLLWLTGRELLNPTVAVYASPSVMLPVHTLGDEVSGQEREISPLSTPTVVLVTPQRRLVFGSCGKNRRVLILIPVKAD